MRALFKEGASAEELSFSRQCRAAGEPNFSKMLSNLCKGRAGPGKKEQSVGKGKHESGGASERASANVRPSVREGGRDHPGRAGF